ncbi:MAG TPA: CD1871A family CXXC motif-containing protein [Treponemataceae bacterium]|jgi:hypothetical protein|nr:CD1871A family CXXC motif-containing protein [Treponemataceae bacterium]
MEKLKKQMHQRPRYKDFVFALLFGLGVFLLIIGLKDGGFLSVFRKAAFICLECIGIG